MKQVFYVNLLVKEVNQKFAIVATSSEQAKELSSKFGTFVSIQPESYLLSKD